MSLNDVKVLVPEFSFSQWSAWHKGTNIRHCDDDHRVQEEPLRQKLRMGERYKSRQGFVFDSTFDFKQRYTADAVGEEMAPNARFWRTYNDEAAVSNAEVMEQYRDTIDILLVFAGLFSAVVTTFVVQASDSLKPDFAQISSLLMVELIAVQRATAKGTPVDDVPMIEPFTFSPEILDVWTYNLWFTSLFLSLITALVAVLAKQWMHHYVSGTSGTARERARLRQSRYTALHKWQVPMIIGCLPVLLHLSLAIFLVGLILSLLSLQLSAAYIVAAISVIVYLAYITSNLLPIAYHQCPYKTPLSIYGYILRRLVDRLWHVTATWLTVCRQQHRWISPTDRLISSLVVPPPSLSLKEAERNAVRDSADQIDAECISWLYTTSSNPTIRQIALESVSGLRTGFPQGLLDVEMFSGDLVQEIHSCYPPHVPTSWQEPYCGAERKAEVMWRTLLQPKQLDTELSIGRDLSFHRTITLDDPLLRPDEPSFTEHPALLATTTCVLGCGPSARRLLKCCLLGHLADLRLPLFLWILLLRQARLQLLNYQLSSMQLALFEILKDSSFFLLGTELGDDHLSTVITAPNKDVVMSMVDLLFDMYRIKGGSSPFHFVSPQLELLLGFVLSVCEVSRQSNDPSLPGDVSESRPSVLKWCSMLVQCLSQYMRRHKLPLGSEEEMRARAHELRTIRHTLCRLVETRIFSGLESTTEEMNIRLATLATLAPLFVMPSPYNVVLEITSTLGRVFATNVVRTLLSATQTDAGLEQDIHARANRLLLYCLSPQWQSVTFYQVFRDEHSLQQLHHRIRLDGMATWKHIVIIYISTIVAEPSFFTLQEHELQLAYIYDPDNFCSVCQVLLHNNRDDLVYALASLYPQSNAWDEYLARLLVWANNHLDGVHRRRTVSTIKDLGDELRASPSLTRLEL